MEKEEGRARGGYDCAEKRQPWTIQEKVMKQQVAKVEVWWRQLVEGGRSAFAYILYPYSNSKSGKRPPLVECEGKWAD